MTWSVRATIWTRLAAVALPVLTCGCAAPGDPGGGLAPAETAAPGAGMCGNFVARHGDSFVVQPNGVDDSAAIQCAMDHVGAGTVQLAAGTFFVAHVVERGFMGKLKGTGAGATIVRNVDRPIDVVPLNWQLEPPSASHPWPSYFTFIDGDFTISDLAIQVVGENPTVPYHAFGLDFTAITHAVSIVGKEVTADIHDVSFAGEESSASVFGFNLVNAIDTEGILGVKLDVVDIPPIAADLTVRNSTFTRLASPAPIFNHANSHIRIVDNEMDGTLLGAELLNLSGTHYVFARNLVRTVPGGNGVAQYDIPKGRTIGMTDASLRFTDNSFAGGALDLSGTFNDDVTCRIARNTFGTMSPDGLQLHLGPAIHGCRVRDVTSFVDEGTGNTIH